MPETGSGYASLRAGANGILLREVRARVLESTGGEDRPHEYAALLGEHYLVGATGPGTRTVADNVSSPALAQQVTEGRAGAPRSIGIGPESKEQWRCGSTGVFGRISLIGWWRSWRFPCRRRRPRGLGGQFMLACAPAFRLRPFL